MTKIRFVKANTFSALAAILSSCAFWAQLGLSSREPLILFVFAAMLFLYRESFNCDQKCILIAAYICGVLFALFSVLGNLEALSDRRAHNLWTLIRFSGLALLYSNILTVIFSKLKDVQLTMDKNEYRNMSARGRIQVFFLCWVPIFLCFGIWWLYEYPGNTSPDSNHQIMQAMGLIPLSSNHPAVSTLMLGFFFNLGMKLFSGDQNAALALYTAFQMLFMSVVFAYLLETLYEARIKKWVIICVLFVYIIYPHHGSYSVTVWKDVMFAGWGTALCVSLWRLILRCRNEMPGSSKNFDLALLYISAMGASLYRNKIYYAFFLLLPLFYMVFRKKNVAAWLMPLIVPIIAIIINGPIFASFDISHNDFIESHSLPAQHIARVIKDGHSLTAKQYELLSKAVDVEAVADTYNANISDPIKALVRSTGDQEYLVTHKGEYTRLWLELGMQYPGAYLRAQIDQTKGYWYPDVNYWSMSNYCEESDVLELVKDRRLPQWWINIFDNVYFYLPSLPFGGIAYSIGTAVWLLIALFALCVVKGMKSELLIYIPVLAIVLTVCIVTPVHAEYRYVYSLFTTLPLLGILPFSHVNCNKAKESA